MTTQPDFDEWDVDMKWKQASVASAVALAVAGVLIASPAMASVATGNPVGTGAELTLIVWDPMAGFAYVRDLGPQTWTSAQAASVFSTSNTTTLFGSSMSSAGDANYQTFLGDLASKGAVNSNSTYWGVYSAVPAGSINYLVTTFDANIPTADIVLNQNLATSVGPASRWASVANGMVVSSVTTELPGNTSNNGSAVSSSSEAASPVGPAAAYWGQGWGLAGNTRTFNQFGVSMSSDFYVVQKTQTTLTNFQQLAGTWTLNASTGDLNYTVAAVPEPSSWGLGLVGLGLVGFVSWRRRKV